MVSDYLAEVGRVDEAVAEMKRARELDPLSFLMNTSVARMLCLARKYDEALAELREPETWMRFPQGSTSGSSNPIG